MAGMIFFFLMLVCIVVLLYAQRKLIKHFEEEDKEMKKLIIYQGIQGSGKTTAARKFVLEDPDNRVRVNRDDIRLMLGKPFNPKLESLVTKIETAALYSAMKAGKTVVSDNMNMNKKTIDFLEEIAKEFGYTTEYRFIYTPLEECIERDSRRKNPVGEKVIRETYRRYEDYIEKHNPNVIFF